jgi:hypothetical protein
MPLAQPVGGLEGSVTRNCGRISFCYNKQLQCESDTVCPQQSVTGP